jgi:hypothetical protein
MVSGGHCSNPSSRPQINGLLFMQHRLNFFPLPHGQGSFLPTFFSARCDGTSGFGTGGIFAAGGDGAGVP